VSPLQSVFNIFFGPLFFLALLVLNNSYKTMKKKSPRTKQEAAFLLLKWVKTDFGLFVWFGVTPCWVILKLFC